MRTLIQDNTFLPTDIKHYKLLFLLSLRNKSMRYFDGISGTVFLAVVVSILTVSAVALEQSPLAPITVPAPVPSSQTVDQGQGVSITVNTPTGGTAPYTYQWQMELPGGSSFSNTTLCSSPTTLTCAFTTSTSTATGQYYFRLLITDSKLPNHVTATSSQAYVIINTQLSVASPTASNGIMDQGQVSVLRVSNPSTGTPPYTYQWFVLNPGAGTYSSISGATATSYNFVTTGTTTTGNYRFRLQIKDSATTSYVVNSTDIQITLNTALSVATPSAVPSSIAKGSSSLITGTAPTSGTSPYVYQWFVLNPGAGTYSSILGATGYTYNFITDSSTPAGTYSFKLEVTDYADTPSIMNSSGVPVSVAETTTSTTSVSTTTVSPSTTTSTVSTTSLSSTSTASTTTAAPSSTTTVVGSTTISTASTSVPSTTTVTTHAKTSPTSISGGGYLFQVSSPTAYGYAVGNFSKFNSAKLTIHGSNYTIFENFIASRYASVTINNKTLNLLPNVPVVFESDPVGQYYVTLTNLTFTLARSYIGLDLFYGPNNETRALVIPTQNSIVNINVSNSRVLPFDFFGIGAAINFSAESPGRFFLYVQNLTSAGNMPPAPENYSRNIIVRIDVKSATSGNRDFINMTLVSNCSVFNEGIVPFVLSGSNWAVASTYSKLPGICETSLPVDHNETIAFMSYVPPSISASSGANTTAETSSVMPTTTIAQNSTGQASLAGPADDTVVAVLGTVMILGAAVIGYKIGPERVLEFLNSLMRK